MPALISFVGASSRGGFSTKAMHPAVVVGGHHAEGGRIGHRVQGDGPLGPALAMERHQCGQVEVGEHVAVDDDEGLVDAGEGGGEADGAGGVQRLGLDRVGQPHAGDPAVRVGLHEGIGQVAQREDGLVDAVRGEVAEHPLDHGHPDDREHLLGRRERQRPEPRPLAAHEDNRFHYLVVVVDEGFVVVVDGGAVVVVAGAQPWCGVAAGAVVEVAPAAVVVVDAAGAWSPASTCCSARIVDAGGLGSSVPSGTNPAVISWRFRNLRSAGLAVVAPPVSSSCPVLGGRGRDHPVTAPARCRPCRHQASRRRTSRRWCTPGPWTRGT